MNIETTDALNRINQRFYTAIADDFSATRRDPWPGWSRAVRHLRCGEGVAPRVLDLGCGNGRFANFLEAEWGPHYHYLGIDSSEGLLGHARTALSGIPRVEFDLLDFLPDTGTLELPEGHFDLVALFGVLHHVPGFEMRRALLRALADLLTPGGTLIIAAWQFGSEARFQSRILPWEQYNAGTREPIDLGELELGDFLLRWANAESPRYCHFVDPDEFTRLLRDLGTQSLDRYTADGKSGDLNLYSIEQDKR